jgi:hypothetical protein
MCIHIYIHIYIETNECERKMRAQKIRSATVQKQKTRRAGTRMPQGKRAKFQAYKGATGFHPGCENASTKNKKSMSPAPF